MMTLVFASNNAHKLEEIRAALGSSVQVLSLNDIHCHADIEETAATLEGNARIKAQYVWQHYHLDCFSDDTGLEVEALHGAPGVYTARYAGPTCRPEDNVRKMLHELQGQDNRRACFRTCICLIMGGEEHFFNGVVQGSIATEQRGTNGFGYDPIFMPDETGMTFAEMGPDAKNQISHRARAIQQMKQFLEQ